MPKNNWFSDMIAGLFDLISTGKAGVDIWVRRLISFAVLLLLVGMSVEIVIFMATYLTGVVGGFVDTASQVASSAASEITITLSPPEVTVPAVPVGEIPIVDG